MTKKEMSESLGSIGECSKYYILLGVWKMSRSECNLREEEEEEDEEAKGEDEDQGGKPPRAPLPPPPLHRPLLRLRSRWLI
jgi:hypothetical protein